MVFFGPVAVLGSAYLQSKAWQWSDFLWSLGPGLLAAAVMSINNLRDRRGDKRQGKKTLAVLLSDRVGQGMPWVFIQLSMVIFLLHSIASKRWIIGLILSAAMLRLLQQQLKPLIFPESRKLNRALKYTSMFVGIYCLSYVLVILF